LSNKPSTGNTSEHKVWWIKHKLNIITVPMTHLETYMWVVKKDLSASHTDYIT